MIRRSGGESTGRTPSSTNSNFMNVSRGKKIWTVEEDEHLKNLVGTFGTGNWTLVAQSLPERTGKQCRERWHNHLGSGIKKGDWTEEEDKIIITMQRHIGNQWAKITKMLPGRTDNAVKNRFHATERARSRGKGDDSLYNIPIDDAFFENLKKLHTDIDFDMLCEQHANSLLSGNTDGSSVDNARTSSITGSDASSVRAGKHKRTFELTYADDGEDPYNDEDDDDALSGDDNDQDDLDPRDQKDARRYSSQHQYAGDSSMGLGMGMGMQGQPSNGLGSQYGSGLGVGMGAGMGMGGGLGSNRNSGVHQVPLSASAAAMDEDDDGLEDLADLDPMDGLMDIDIISFDSEELDLNFDTAITAPDPRGPVGGDNCCFGYFDWGCSGVYKSVFNPAADRRNNVGLPGQNRPVPYPNQNQQQSNFYNLPAAPSAMEASNMQQRMSHSSNNSHFSHQSHPPQSHAAQQMLPAGGGIPPSGLQNGLSNGMQSGIQQNGMAGGMQGMQFPLAPTQPIEMQQYHQHQQQYPQQYPAAPQHYIQPGMGIGIAQAGNMMPMQAGMVGGGMQAGMSTGMGTGMGAGMNGMQPMMIPPQGQYMYPQGQGPHSPTSPPQQQMQQMQIQPAQMMGGYGSQQYQAPMQGMGMGQGMGQGGMGQGIGQGIGIGQGMSQTMNPGMGTGMGTGMGQGMGMNMNMNQGLQLNQFPTATLQQRPVSSSTYTTGTSDSRPVSTSSYGGSVY